MNKSLEELACLYVLDQLERRERAAFEARLLRDPELAAFVRELEPTLARGISELPQHTPSAGVLNRIEARIDALGDTGAAREPRRARGRFNPAQGGAPLWRGFFSLARWGIAAVIAVSLATIAIQSLREPAPGTSQPVVVFVGLDANKNTFAELPMRDGAKDPDARFIQLATLAENYWRKPGELPIGARTAPGDNRGYALFDPASRQGFIVIEQLPVASEGQRYHLWVVDPSSGRASDAGILPLDGMSRGFYSFTIGSDDSLESGRPNFFVTLEENGVEPAPTQPRGKVVLGRNDI
jgi:anti-sigma-K factor RskA